MKKKPLISCFRTKIFILSWDWRLVNKTCLLKNSVSSAAPHLCWCFRSGGWRRSCCGSARWSDEEGRLWTGPRCGEIRFYWHSCGSGWSQSGWSLTCRARPGPRPRTLWSPAGSRCTAGWRTRSPAETPSAPADPPDPGSPTDCPPAADQNRSG